MELLAPPRPLRSQPEQAPVAEAVNGGRRVADGGRGRVLGWT